MAQQQRGFHTLRRPTPRRDAMPSQRRNLYIKQSQALDLLAENGVPVKESPTQSGGFSLGVSIDRDSHSPCIVASPTTDPSNSVALSQKFSFPYGRTTFPPDGREMRAVAAHVGLSVPAQVSSLSALVEKLVGIFMNKEAFVLETNVGTSPDGGLQVQGARFGFDDAAYRSSQRQEDIHKLRNKAEEVPEEVEAEKDGIVFIKYVVHTSPP